MIIRGGGDHGGRGVRVGGVRVDCAPGACLAMLVVSVVASLLLTLLLNLLVNH